MLTRASVASPNMLLLLIRLDVVGLTKVVPNSPNMTNGQILY